MKKNIINELMDIFNKFLEINNIEKVDFIFEKIKNIEWGDYSTNIAMVLSKVLSKNPMDIALDISQKISSPIIKEISIKNPGFINIFLNNIYYDNLIENVIQKGDEFGQYDKKDIIYNIEYVSANPTGSLHIGHARNASLGSTIANIWEKFGISVDREYYINDGGAQINKLGVAVLIRYKQLFNIEVKIPEDSYHGEEPKWVAEKIKEKYNDKFLETQFNDLMILEEKDRKIINDYSKLFLMEKIKESLEKFKAKFDIYFPESEIFKKNLIDKSLDALKKYLYEKDGAIWLKTTDFKDDKDRVLIKSDKSFTYFLPDISYHYIKLSRKNYTKIFDIFGADHGSYATRIKAACECFGYKDKLEIIIMQMVKLFKNGEPYKMSKRSGTSLTLDDLINSIGVDSARWYLVSQSPNSHIEIDIDKVVKQDSSNPLYYVMYAHARISQVLNNYKFENSTSINTMLLTNIKERELLNLISFYPYLIESISNNYDVHSLNSFLLKISSIFHSYYSETRIITNDIKISNQRILLIKSIKSIIASGLKILEINAMDEI